jgi:outer membrane protein OmpA-like peptidoglycan-associated protein
MTERALTPAPTGAHAADRDAVRPESPAIQLLDAMRDGDDRAVVAAIGQSTTVTAENLPWACRGPDEVDTMLREVRERFPGLTFESTTRHVGFGVVIEEARVRDVIAEDAATLHAAEAADKSHPMWDQPDTRPSGTELVLYGKPGEVALPGPVALPPIPLNLPVRVTVRHDDLQVYEVRLSFPAALLRRALGEYVDPLEVSLSEVQSAFIAPVGADLTTHDLAGPEPAPTTPTHAAVPAQPAGTVGAPTRRRRRRLLVPVVLVLLALLAGAGWWFVQGQQAFRVDSPRQASAVAPSAHASQPAAQPSTSQAPTVTRSESTAPPTRTPNVTLRSDLAFGINSATLSPAAQVAVAQVAHQVRRAGLTGKIYVDGYTDDVGSAAYGLVLSQRRADAVSAYLQSQLPGAPVSIVSVGHGEADPAVSNATADGRQQNRRVTITLPQP